MVSDKTVKPEGSPISPAASAAANSLTIQCSLAIGAVNDPLEEEADSMADKVMRMPQPHLIQRKCSQCEEEEKVQRKPLAAAITPYIQKKSNADSTASASLTSQINATRGSGSAMDNSTQSFMGSRFGTDFSNVKIHTGDYAIQMNKELNAQAFTVGNDIYFNSGKYSPTSASGKYLLAHELTHTLQQDTLVKKIPKIQRQKDKEKSNSIGSCQYCQIPGGVGVCCSSSDMPLIPECWDLAKKVIDKCPGHPSSCLIEAKCTQCQCVAAKRGKQYCQCTGIV